LHDRVRSQKCPPNRHFSMVSCNFVQLVQSPHERQESQKCPPLPHFSTVSCNRAMSCNPSFARLHDVTSRLVGPVARKARGNA
jgi:hypothetical protein